MKINLLFYFGFLALKTHPVPLKEKEQGWGSSWGGKLCINHIGT